MYRLQNISSLEQTQSISPLGKYLPELQTEKLCLLLSKTIPQTQQFCLKADDVVIGHSRYSSIKCRSRLI